MLRFEAALVEAEADLGIVPAASAAAIVKAIETLRPSAAALAAGLGRDGVIVPTLVELLRQAIAEKHRPHVHFGATSQDVIDTGFILRLKETLAIMRQDLGAVLGRLDDLKARHGRTEVMGRTRMRHALPIAFADRVATWASPLSRHVHALDRLESRILAVQFGGAVGTLDRLGERGAPLRAALARRLDLLDPDRSWHAERDRMADLANWLSQVSGSLGKIGQDLVLMAQDDVGEAVLAGGGRSSAMPGKRNPVQAEILVALARFNAGQLGTMHQALVHEGERSGAAWTLEWLVLPQMIAATAAALTVSGQCLEGLEVSPSA